MPCGRSYTIHPAYCCSWPRVSSAPVRSVLLEIPILGPRRLGERRGRWLCGMVASSQRSTGQTARRDRMQELVMSLARCPASRLRVIVSQLPASQRCRRQPQTVLEPVQLQAQLCLCYIIHLQSHLNHQTAFSSPFAQLIQFIQVTQLRPRSELSQVM